MTKRIAGQSAASRMTEAVHLSPRRADLASFAHAYAVAVQRRAAGEGHLFIIATADPAQPFRVAAAAPANDGHVLACVA